MTFLYTPDMMPISDTLFNSKSINLTKNANYSLCNCRLGNNFIYYVVNGRLFDVNTVSLSDKYQMVTTITRKSTATHDIIVYDTETKDIYILIQRNDIFLFDCPDDLWLLFQAILTVQHITTIMNYTTMSKEYVDNNRFSISKLDNKQISQYIVEELIKDRVLKVL